VPFTVQEYLRNGNSITVTRLLYEDGYALANGALAIIAKSGSVQVVTHVLHPTQPISYVNSSTNFNLSVASNITDVLQMQLNSIELPTTYYAISKQYGNNYFSITINDGSISNTVIEIPDGNYTQQTIMNIINLH
jgi:hypothetical protein